MKTNYIDRLKKNIKLPSKLPKITHNITITTSTDEINFEKNINYFPKNKLSKSSLKEILNTKKPIKKKYKPNKAVDLIHKLNLESNLKELFSEELKKEAKREKIDSDKEIKDKRLGLFIKTELSPEEEKNKERNINFLKGFSMDKIDKLDHKEKEKKKEMQYKKGLKEIEELEIKLKELYKKIIKLTEIIEGHKLDINVLDSYGKEMDKKNIDLDSPIKKRKRKNSVIIKEESPENKKMRRSSVYKKHDFEKECKLIVKKHQRDEKEKKIQNEVGNNIKKMENLLKEQEYLKEKLNDKKMKIYNLKKELIDIYHTSLFEGLDFRGEGLARIILNIWNLGVNIDMNFIPSYLDNKSIEFLFNKARQIIETRKKKELLEKSQKDFLESLNDWKNDVNIQLNSERNMKHFLFKTKISDEDENSFIDRYPNSTLFMNNYKKENENEFENNDLIKYNKNITKSWEIPKIIIEKNKNIEKNRYLLQSLKKQIELEDKNEVIRLCKEFLFNDYEEKYNVCIETIIGALYGEIRKDEMLNFYYRIKKENKDNLKKIEFYYPLSERKEK